MINDIHSHNLHNNPEEQIISLCMKDNESILFHNAINISVGIHPWFLSENDINNQIQWVKDMAENDKRVIAIGECGTDKICNTPIELQTKAFRAMIEVSEEMKLPLIIHSVKTINEVISLKKQLKPKQKWIIHGFRGKKDMALQLINHGIYISIGERFNEESIKNIPLEMILIETDESCKTTNQISEAIALSKEISKEELINSITESTNNLFFNK